MYLQYTSCCPANLYPSGALIQEEALQMKQRMGEAVPELDKFHASDGWLESFMMSYGIRETTTTIVGEAVDIPIATVKAWMESLPKCIKGDLPEDILNMDEIGLLFKTLPQIILAEEGKKDRGGKKVKNDALSHCLWLLMALKFVTLLWYGDPKSLVALRT